MAASSPRRASAKMWAALLLVACAVRQSSASEAGKPRNASRAAPANGTAGASNATAARRRSRRGSDNSTGANVTIRSAVVGAASAADDRICARVEVKCESLKYTLACDLSKACDAITCTGAAGEEIVDAFTPEDAAELLQNAVDTWVFDKNGTCRARETLGEGPSCMQALFSPIRES